MGGRERLNGKNRTIGSVYTNEEHLLEAITVSMATISTQDSPVRSSAMDTSSSSFPEAGQSKESGLELVVDAAGKAILVGDDDNFDVERDDGLYNNNMSTPTDHTKQHGVCPVWLRSSSPKMKGFLSIATIAFIASAVVLILGVLQLAPTWNGSIESDKNSVTTPGGANAPASTDMSVVNIRLSDDLEVKVPNFSDELTTAQMEDWNLVKESIEHAISASLLGMLPTGYTVKSVQVDKFDEHSIGSPTRQLQDIAIIHAVQYSSAITANCTIADCSTAATAVASASTELYETVLDVSSNVSSEVSVETEDTKSPAVSTATISPTKSVTIAPTVNPVSESEPPLSGAPTTMLVLSDVVKGCSQVEPCGLCNGGCVDDDGCEEGLFCFRRIGYETVPGCEGPGIFALSYCYNPFVFGLTETELLLDEHECDREKDRQCEKCRGECSDDDDDCKDDLFCYRRFGFEQVPGCTGQVCQCFPINRVL